MKKISLYIIITSLSMLVSMNALFSQDLEGYTAGINIGYPIFSQEYYTDATGPGLGIVVGTPFEFDMGNYSVGVGGGIDSANFGADASYTGLYVTLNSIVYETTAGPLSASVGGGYYMGGDNDLYPSSLGINGGIAIEYALSNQNIVIQPYARGAYLFDVDGNGNKQGWLSIGAMINYDISTLF